MKTLIPLLSLLCGSFAVQNCSDEDQEFQNQPEIVQVTTEDDSVSNSNRRDSTKSENYELYPDPPVKDTHDWRTNP
ncbi:hypothetical protein ACI513_03465 [Chryseobacterium sp. M5]|uniref:hypothetical protein n=1 Tax=Chryseobacterium sp. M5 TaxID=3379128 RepID=UPI00385719AE